MNDLEEMLQLTDELYSVRDKIADISRKYAASGNLRECNHLEESIWHIGICIENFRFKEMEANEHHTDRKE